MWAIFSDIHGNLEALQAILNDAAELGCEKIICLGDSVGCGPNPLECLELSDAWDVVLQGHCECGVLYDDFSGWTSRGKVRSLLWVRELLQALPERREAIARMPRRHEIGETQFLPGSPRNPLNEYILPHDVENARKMERIAEHLRCYCFNGHTHIPGVFVESLTGQWKYLASAECPQGFRFDRRRVICNVGSVGQPADGDWRACYATYDGEVVRFRRVPYDVESTVRKIYANPELDNFFGDRLREGR